MRLSSLLVNLGSVALLAMAQSIHGQQPAPPANPSAGSPLEPPPMLTVVSRAVVLDIVVTDAAGHPVKGLEKSDFTLLEDSVPQTLKSFEEQRFAAPSTANAGPKLPANTYTNYIAAPPSSAYTVLLIDTENTGIEAQMQLHQQLLDYLKQQPAAPIAIFVLDSRVHMVQGFTTDRQLLLDAIDRGWAKPHLGFFDAHNDAYRHFRRDILREGMQELGRYLSGFPGRKNLIWFIDPAKVVDAFVIFPTGTGTVPVPGGALATPLAGGRTGSSTPRAPGEAAALGTLEDEEPIDLIGNQFRDTDNFQDDLSETTDVLTLSRVAVYPVDARGLVAGGPHTGERVNLDNSYLSPIADATGGKSFYNTNGIGRVIAEVVEAGSNYYTVSYTPANRNWNGNFRHIKVEVKGGRFHLAYRNGYLARDRNDMDQLHLAAMRKKQVSGNFIPAAETQSGAPQGVLIHHGADESLQASMTLGAVPPTELVFAASLAPSAKIEKVDKKAPLPPGNYLRPKFRAAPYRNYSLLYAADIRRIGFNRTPDGVRHNQLDFVAVVYDDQGAVVNSLLSTMNLDLSEATYRRMEGTGLVMSQRIAVPVKGKYFFRLGIRDAAGDRVGAMEIPVADVKPGVAGAGQTLTP